MKNIIKMENSIIYKIARESKIFAVKIANWQNSSEDSVNKQLNIIKTNRQEKLREV